MYNIFESQEGQQWPWSDPTWRIISRFGCQSREGPQWQRSLEVEKLRRSIETILNLTNTYRQIKAPGLCWGNTKKSMDQGSCPWGSHRFGLWGSRYRTRFGRRSTGSQVPAGHREERFIRHKLGGLLGGGESSILGDAQAALNAPCWATDRDIRITQNWCVHLLVYSFAAKIKDHRRGGLNDRNVVSHSSGGWKLFWGPESVPDLSLSLWLVEGHPLHSPCMPVCLQTSSF